MKLNFPNILVLVRLILVPVILLLLLFPNDPSSKEYIKEMTFNWTDALAGVLFIIASITDFVDGWYARKYNQVTTFGKLFDPLADKILVNSVLIVFSARGIVPIFFVVIFICRDILVDGLRMMLASNDIVLAADKWGKLKTIFQMIGLTIVFFYHPVPFVNFGFNWNGAWESIVLLIPLMIGLLFSIYSGVNYYVRGFEGLKEKN